jgi:hypothetical protein
MIFGWQRRYSFILLFGRCRNRISSTRLRIRLRLCYLVISDILLMLGDAFHLLGAGGIILIKPKENYI